MIEEYLISEGYADNYKSASKIVEAMSDIWYEMIYEAMVSWREKRGDGLSPSERAANTRSKVSRDATAIRQGRKKGDFIQTTKNLLRVTKAVDKLNKENPVAPTKGMTGRRGSQEGGKPQTNIGGTTRTGGTTFVNPQSAHNDLENAATRSTGISSRTTSTGVPLRSLAPQRRTRDVNKVSRNLGTTTTQPGGTLPKF